MARFWLVEERREVKPIRRPTVRLFFFRLALALQGLFRR